MPSTTIARGNAISTFYISAALTPTSISGASATQTYSVPGLLTTDIIQVIGVIGSQTAGVSAAEADCLTAGILSIQWINASGSAATPTVGNYALQIVRPEGSLPTTAV
jgi:hypothetical protein